MDKSVLVMDTPEKCIHCLLLNGADECIVQDDDANFNASDSWDELMKGCPLKKLPEEENGDEDLCSFDRGWTAGFNTCLQMIRGENSRRSENI